MNIGEFEYLLLTISASLGEDAYGAAIRKSLLELEQPRSVGAIQTGLDRLERKGLIRTHLGAPTAERGGRAKRMVEVTPEGVRSASEFYHMVRSVTRNVRWEEYPR